MNYLALGDSISIDDYTNVAGGGAVSQFAHKIGAPQVQDLTQDGRTTDGVIDSLRQINITPDIVTLTAGGNDFLRGASQVLSRQSGASWEKVAHTTLNNLRFIADRLKEFQCPVLLNTVYDPTDGDDSLLAQFGLADPTHARATFNALNDGLRVLAHEHDFLLADLEHLFHGHGAMARDTWFVMHIEPNLAGATAIADEWYRIYNQWQAI